jgi:acetolactate synthase I/II/III large subunit
MRVADRIWQIVKDAGVDTVFFVPGGGSAFLVDALGTSGLDHVSMLHEQGAAYAAVAYGMMRGLGVCLTTSGPGATNALTGCAAAWTDSAPVLFISGQAASDTLIYNSGLRTKGQQEIDIVNMVHPITKSANTVHYGSLAVMRAKEMTTQCQDGRPGPCWIDIPLDIQGREV